jgi:hypothetical protein
MSSRRRNSKKNLGTNLSDIQRRLRRMERKPIRTRLQNRVIKGAAIAPSSITADEVEFGTAIVSSDPENDVLNPKDGLLVINPDDNAAFVYSQDQGDYLEIKDANAQASADGKNTIYYSDTAPAGTSYITGDTWFDTDDGYKIYTWNGTAWAGFELGSNAIASISATKILAGSLAANVIVTSNLDAGQITAGTLTGRTIRTASSGRRVEVDATNNALSFYNAAGTALGHIRPASDYSGVIISSGGSATTDFASSTHPKMLMYPSGNDGQFTLVLNNASAGFSVSSAGGIQTANLGATNTSTLAIVFSLREVGLAQSSVFPDLTAINSISGPVEGQIVLTYS